VDSIDQALKTFSKAICLPAKGKQDNAKTSTRQCQNYRKWPFNFCFVRIERAVK
jgi:hypothetical protein